jgi:cobalt-zinc-cadmium efflux system protein
MLEVWHLALALFAINYTRRPRTPQRTYGFYRIEILASLTNSVVLVLLSIYICYEAYIRFFEPPDIQSLPMIIVAAIGLVVNYIGLRMLGGHSHDRSHPDHDDDYETEKVVRESLNIIAIYLS